jgi:biopolymer transport protein ExbB
MYVFVFLVLGMVGVVCGEEISGQQGAARVSYFARFVIGGGWITWFILLPLSVATLALVLVYALTVRRSRLLPESVRLRLDRLRDQRDYQRLRDYAANQPSMLGQIVSAGMGEIAYGQTAAQRALDEAAEQQSSRLLRRIEWLNLIGNISPMIGLFGTVTGMIQAFYELVEISAVGGAANAAQLADAISLALVTTFWGLAIAIPALAVFAILRNRIDALAADCWLVGAQLLEAMAPAVEQTPNLHRGQGQQ